MLPGEILPLQLFAIGRLELVLSLEEVVVDGRVPVVVAAVDVKLMPHLVVHGEGTTHLGPADRRLRLDPVPGRGLSGPDPVRMLAPDPLKQLVPELDVLRALASYWLR